MRVRSIKVLKISLVIPFNGNEWQK